MRKILIIEDDFDVRCGLVDLLEGFGFRCVSASSGREGIVLAGEVLPDLIICDIMMPGGLDGYDVINELNNHESTRLIPVIFLTAKGDMSDLRKGMLAGAADYIVKPYDAREILKAVNLRIDKAEALKNSLLIPEPENREKFKRFSITDTIPLLENNNPVFLRIAEIVCITADNIYSAVFICNKKKILIRKPLRQWEEILPEACFFRIHRSTIINTNMIDKIEKWYKRSYKVYLKNYPESFIISERYAKKIKDSFLL